MSKSEAELKKEYEEYASKSKEELEYKAYQDSQGFMAAEEAMNNRGIPSGDQLDTLSDMAVSIPQGITTWADEAQAGTTAGIKSLASKEPFSDLYEKDVKDIRGRLALARERSPIAAPLTELGTGIATAFIPGLGAGKLTGAGSQIGRAAFEGLGTAEDKMGWEGITQAAIGGGMGAGGALISGGLKKISTANPDKIRANVLGARTSEFKEIGIKEREKIAKELKDMGLFQKTKVAFDTAKGKFVSKGKTLENLEKPAREKILNRLEEAGKTIQEEKMKILGKYADDFVDMGDIEEGLNEVVEKYAPKATGISARRKAAEKIKDDILQDILERSDAGDGYDITIRSIEEAKNRLSNDVGNYGKNPLLQKTPDEAQIFQNMYTAINNKLKSQLGNTKYAKFNDLQSKMLTAKTDIMGAIASEDATKASAGWGGWFNKIANETLGSPEAGLGMANMAEIAGKPGIKQAVTASRMATAELPFSGIRYLDPSLPAAEIPYAPEEQSMDTSFETGSQPQGFSQPNGIKPAFGKGQFNPISRKYNSLGSDEMTPMQLVKAKLPRTTKGLLANKELVLKKLAIYGVPDDLIDTVSQALNDDPESVESLGAMVTMQFPTLFEKSKYNMFDGKILDPSQRAKAADDTSKRSDINSIERAKIISELNKSGKYLGE